MFHKNECPVVDGYPFSPCLLQSWGRERTKEGKDICHHLYLITRVAPIKGRSKVEKTEKTRMQYGPKDTISVLNIWVYIFK